MTLEQEHSAPEMSVDFKFGAFLGEIWADREMDTEKLAKVVATDQTFWRYVDASENVDDDEDAPAPSASRFLAEALGGDEGMIDFFDILGGAGVASFLDSFGPQFLAGFITGAAHQAKTNTRADA